VAEDGNTGIYPFALPDIEGKLFKNIVKIGPPYISLPPSLSSITAVLTSLPVTVMLPTHTLVIRMSS
jgi:hypothetical protein